MFAAETCLHIDVSKVYLWKKLRATVYRLCHASTSNVNKQCVIPHGDLTNKLSRKHCIEGDFAERNTN